MTALVDWRGNAYGVGDTILYPGAQGSSSAFLTEATVLEYFPREGDKWGDKPARLRVQPVRTSGYSNGRKVVTLTNFRSITVVAP